MNPENISVLIVDDETIIVEQLVFFFNSLSYSVTGLSDPEEALELLHKQAFDIVLTDLKMPRISGMDLIQAIKLLKHDTKIIIFTGYATTDSAIEALKQGVYSYILKPYDLQELRTTVENAATELYLKRENIILNQKIKLMFEYMSTLYDIVSILYQVSDFDLTMEMILDTLKEGIKVEKAFISLLNEENTRYAIHSVSGLPAQFKNDFVFNIGDTMGNIPISAAQSQIIHAEDLSDHPQAKLFQTIDNFRQLLLIPIKYQEKVLGFIGTINLTESVFLEEDILKLLDIFAVQIGPIIHNYRLQEVCSQKSTPDDIIDRIISHNIVKAKESQSILSFALLRLTTNPQISQLPPLDDIKNSFKEITQREFQDEAEIVWQNFDSALIISPNKDSVANDLSCSHLRTEIEKYFSTEENEIPISLNYSIAFYPKDGNSSNKILTTLNARLLNTYDNQTE